MVGVVWQSDLRFYEYGPADSATTVATILGQIRRAVRDGARVVNFSSAISASWGIRTPNSRADSQVVQAVRRMTAGMLTRLKTDGYDPVLVVPAGDFFGPIERDAYWAGYAAAKLNHPGNVLVVGSASRLRGALTPTSGRGSLVSVAAVGESVYALDSASVEGRPRSGVSFATPQASGVIGLLIAFDPRLTASELIQLIEEWSRNAWRGGWGHPVP
jgi:subtilisin family serine protease